MKGLILISAYNAAKTLSDVLQEVSKYSELSIVVVNDGSTDNTGDIARSQGVHVIDHKVNQGKGAALQTGFTYARKQDIDFLITLDADKQHPVDKLNHFIQKHKEHPDSIIMGSRKRNKNMPFTRKFSNSGSAFLISKRIGQKIYDVQCGLRLIPKQYLSWKLSKLKGFIFELEFVIIMAKNGVKFQFIPIPTLYPDQSETKMTYFDSTFGFIFMYISSFFKSYKQEKYDV